MGWSDSTGRYPGYIQDVYQAILALRDTRQPFDVYTGKRMLSSMLFGNITPTTDETSENALFLRVRLQQVIISSTATSGTTAAQADPKSTGGEPNMGIVTAKPMGQGGIGSDAVAGAAALRAMETPVTTGVGGISGLPVAT